MSRPIGAARMGLLPPYLFAAIEQKIAEYFLNGIFQHYTGKPAAQAVGYRLGHRQFHERPDQFRPAWKIDHPVVVGARRQFALAAFRGPLHQHALGAAQH